jgi:hypothetical protein
LGFSFKVSTIFPSGSKAREIFDGVADFASKYSEPVQIQISLISTSEEYRKDAAGIKVASFEDISAAAEHWKDRNPDGRKINLSLILNEDTPANVEDIKSILTPELFRVRLRPCVSTDNGKAHGLKTISNIRYAVIKDQFRQAGYEVGDWAIPTETEQRHGLASNVTLHRYKQHKNQF